MILTKESFYINDSKEVRRYWCPLNEWKQYLDFDLRRQNSSCNNKGYLNNIARKKTPQTMSNCVKNQTILVQLSMNLPIISGMKIPNSFTNHF